MFEITTIFPCLYIKWNFLFLNIEREYCYKMIDQSRWNWVGFNIIQIYPQILTEISCYLIYLLIDFLISSLNRTQKLRQPPKTHSQSNDALENFQTIFNSFQNIFFLGIWGFVSTERKNRNKNANDRNQNKKFVFVFLFFDFLFHLEFRFCLRKRIESNFLFENIIQ